jgi:hypothetical protein
LTDAIYTYIRFVAGVFLLLVFVRGNIQPNAWVRIIDFTSDRYGVWLRMFQGLGTQEGPP